MTGLDLDVVEKPSIVSEVYFIPKSDDYHLTAQRAVGVAKRMFREEHPDTEKVAASSMQHTWNGIHVLAMEKGEPNYIDQIALKALRENPQAVEDIISFDLSLSDLARDHLIDEARELDHKDDRNIEEIADALDRANARYYDMLGK